MDAKVPLSHDTILLRLKLDSAKHQCGLPVGYTCTCAASATASPARKR